MERGRGVAIAVVGVVVLLLTTGVILRAAGQGSDRLATDAGRGPRIELGEEPGSGLQPGERSAPVEATVPPTLLPVLPVLPPDATLPRSSVVTIPLPDFSATASNNPGTAPPSGPAFSRRGVWVVKADGTAPTLVAADATAGVAASGSWVAFLEGENLRAVRLSDLRTKVDLASGVSGTAAQGLPIAGGRRGVAFLQGGRAVLVDPARPSQPVASFAAPTAEAVAAEEDGEGRLVWADADGLHIGSQAVSAPAGAERGILVMGHDLLARLRDGRVTLLNGPSLDWGPVDRLQTGPAGMVAASGGRVRLRTRSGEERLLLDQASTPVITGDRILYVASSRTIATASLAGTDVRTVASAAPGRSITNLDLLDDSTLVVTVG